MIIQARGLLSILLGRYPWGPIRLMFKFIGRRSGVAYGLLLRMSGRFLQERTEIPFGMEDKKPDLVK